MNDERCNMLSVQFCCSQDHVAIVRVTLSNERSFLTTLSPTPLSYDLVRKGVSRDRYLEIDTKFAKELGITIPGTEVTVKVENH